MSDPVPRAEFEALKAAKLDAERELTDQLQRLRAEAADGWRLAQARGLENGRLRKMIEGLAERVAMQSELLSRKAEKA